MIIRIASFLVSFGLVVADGAAAATIPKQIIQTSKSKDLPADWQSYQTSLRELNPDFQFLHFDDDEALAFIEEHFSGTILHSTYSTVTPIMKADLFRLAAIYVLGGFYMDMDMMGRKSLDPLVADIDSGKYQAAFPKEWWMSAEFYKNILPGRNPQDPEDHWQVGQYAFAAVPKHPFVKDILEEAIVRSIRLMRDKKPEDIRDVDILATTGPYLLTDLYHEGRKHGKYGDVLHIGGDSSDPVLKRSHGGNDWHKFGPYCEHMLSHTWVKSDRRMQEYGTYGTEDPTAGADIYSSANGLMVGIAAAIVTTVTTAMFFL